MAGERVLAALAGDERGHAAILEPAKQPPQLRTQHHFAGQSGEQRLDGVEHDTPGADRVDGMAEADEETFEIVVAGLLDLAAFDAHVIEHDLFLSLQQLEVEAERAQVLCQLGRAFLEHHEDAGLAELDRAAHQELGGEHRLAASRSAADECRSPARQTTAGQLVETLNPGRRLGQRDRGFSRAGLCLCLCRGHARLPSLPRCPSIPGPHAGTAARVEARRGAGRRKGA
jgi:hypothetical protein